VTRTVAAFYAVEHGAWTLATGKRLGIEEVEKVEEVEEVERKRVGKRAAGRKERKRAARGLAAAPAAK